MKKIRPVIAVAEGDGIGPEIMKATLRILEAAGAEIDIKKVEIGEKVGIDPSALDTICTANAFLKSPITTSRARGVGFKSITVTLRTTLGLYANVRPCVAYHPFVQSKHPGMDVVVIRENEEDLYTGIEYQHTPKTYHALKIITKPACEKIIRYAFEYAHINKRKKVTCFSKDNILKLTDGVFRKTFDEISREYTDIQPEYYIVDIGTAKLADTPQVFDVIVLPNLYGDIISDMAAQIAGSIGLSGTANIGEKTAMFEAIHGSAPDLAGKNLANPSGLLCAAVMMLVYVGESNIANLIHDAWLCTLEDGMHTADIYSAKKTKKQVGTQEFADEVIARLGQKPHTLQSTHYTRLIPLPLRSSPSKVSQTKKILLGVDVFIQFEGNSETLLKKCNTLFNKNNFILTEISHRGMAVTSGKILGDSWRCRFTAVTGKKITYQHIVDLLQQFANANIVIDQTQNLYQFDDENGFTSSC